MLRWKRLAAVAVVATLGLSGCAGNAQAGSSSADSTLTLGVLVAATTFEAANMNFANESPYGQAVYDTLLRETPDAELEPSLATDWEYNDDNTVLTLTLRDDVTFTDGTAFNADAAAQNLVRFRDGTSANSSFLAALGDAKAIDDTHVELTLTQSDPALLHYLTQNAGMQESPAAFANADVKTNPVGSGPYILDTDKTVVGTSYEFTKNPDYWNPETVHYDNLVLKVYGDSTSLVNAIKGGQLNGAKVIDNVNNAEIEAAGFTLNPFELDWTGLIIFDRDGSLNPALADVRVRQALNYAIDTEAMLNAVGEGLGTPTTQIFPPSSVAYDKSLDSRYAYDPAEAKSLLAAAGYADGLTLDMPSTALGNPAVFTLVQQQLSDVGITVTYTDTGTNFIADLLAPKYGVSWMQLQQDADWALVNFELTKDASFNPTKYDDPTVAALVETIHTGTADESDAALQELNAYIVEQAWFAPWYRVQLTYVTDGNTDVETQVGNTYPYLWNITPAN